MDSTQFDHLARALSRRLHRRRALTGLGLSLLGSVLPGLASAAPNVNPFGCRNVRQRCKRASQCCSGICKGKPGKKHCKAHDTGGCQAGDGQCSPGALPCTTSTGRDGTCQTTTGNAGFCEDGGGCQACTRDSDCQQTGNKRGACIVCTACQQGTACAFP